MLWEMSTLVSAVHLWTYFCFMFSLKGCNAIYYAGKTLYNSQRNPRCVISQFQISWQFLQLNYTLLYATVRKSARSHRWITETKTKPAPISPMKGTVSWDFFILSTKVSLIPTPFLLPFHSPLLFPFHPFLTSFLFPFPPNCTPFLAGPMRQSGPLRAGRQGRGPGADRHERDDRQWPSRHPCAPRPRRQAHVFSRLLP